jgi:hypothetical protein
MGHIPDIGRRERFPTVIGIPDYAGDHHLMGRPVLPAVDAMEALAQGVRSHDSDLPVSVMRAIRFDKFLYLDHQGAGIDAFIDIEILESGAVGAALVTRSRAPGGAITRTKAHAGAVFSRESPPLSTPVVDPASLRADETIRPETIYRDFVPFGPAYRNLGSPVSLSPEGAWARLHSPEVDGDRTDRLLGKGFSLDAAFHVACVWGQRYVGIVGFPVAIDRRVVSDPLNGGGIYDCRVQPRQIASAGFTVDLWIWDARGRLRETVVGLTMRDVSGGKLKPPAGTVRFP